MTTVRLTRNEKVAGSIPAGGPAYASVGCRNTGVALMKSVTLLSCPLLVRVTCSLKQRS